MKNLHVLHSTKPSKLGLIYESNSYHIFTNGENPHDICDNLAVYKNIYITSEEGIKEGDCYYNERLNQVFKAIRKSGYNTIDREFKIVLTTDQNLIKDGVQSIDDEFLEWFVKNPSCKRVDIDEVYVKVDLLEYKTIYKIIIPKEEWISPMQKFKLREEIYTETQQKSLEFNKSLVKFITTEELDLLMSKFDNIEPKQREMFLMNANTVIDTRRPKQELDCPYDFTSRCVIGRCDCKPKQETLEEAAKNYAIDNSLIGYELMPYKGFIEGAKWQQERSYSKDEVLEILRKSRYNEFGIDDLEKWFENFKKK